VTVSYELRNQNDAETKVDIYFVTPAIDSLSVTEEGRGNIGTRMTPSSWPDNWHAKIQQSVTDPLSGKALPLSSYGEDPAHPVGTQFTLIFQPGETKSIVIEYEDGKGIYEKGVIQTIYSHLYYLTPAKFWEGEPHVELAVKFTDAGAKLHSNLPLVAGASGSYSAEFTYLPEEDWYLSYTYPSRILFPTNIAKEHNVLVLATVLVLTAISAAVAVRLRRSSVFLLAALGMLIFTFYYISHMGGYPFNFIFVMFTDIAVGIFLLLIYLWVRARIKAKGKLGG
jgi:hypothetical protein